MTTRRLSLVDELTPEQQAERDFNMIASAFPSETLEVKLLRVVLRNQARLEAMVQAVQPAKATEHVELVDAKTIMAELGLGRTAANSLIHKIGALKVGSGRNGGSLLRCRRDALERYKLAPDEYIQRRAA